MLLITYKPKPKIKLTSPYGNVKNYIRFNLYMVEFEMLIEKLMKENKW